MEKLTSHIIRLQQQSQTLEPNLEKRNLLLEEVHEYANRFIERIDETRAFIPGNVTPNSLTIDNIPKPLEILLQQYKKEVEEHGINAASGGHIGYIPGGGIFASGLGDFLADITNEYAGVYFASPGAVTIENECIKWLKKVFGFPLESLGNLTSGGSIANLIALTAARDKHGIKNEKISDSVVYLSPQVHHCIHKALRIIGLEDIQVRYLELDEFHRINPGYLQNQIESDSRNGLHPFLVIASAGTTDTGAIDPLREIGEIAQKHNLWYHIDGAYGGFFILTDSKKQLFNGIEMADSLVIDPHKGLFLPYGTGAVLVKDKEALLHSHHYSASYMQDATEIDEVLSPAEVSPELTKHFRGLRMWLPLQMYGIEPFKACLEEKILLTEYFRKRLMELGFKVGPEPDLSVSYFWYPQETLEQENELNKKLMAEIHKDGRIFLSSTNINERFVIRMAILSFRTKLHTIDKAVKMIENCLNLLSAEFKLQ